MMKAKWLEFPIWENQIENGHLLRGSVFVDHCNTKIIAVNKKIRIRSMCRSYCQYYICSDFYKIIKSCLQININKPEDSSLSFLSLSIKCFKKKTMNKQVIQVNWNASISQLFTVRSKIDNSLIMNHQHKVSHWTTWSGAFTWPKWNSVKNFIVVSLRIWHGLVFLQDVISYICDVIMTSFMKSQWNCWWRHSIIYSLNWYE